MIRLFIITLIMLSLSACSFKPVTLPEVHNYTLSNASNKKISRFPNVASIQVLQPTTSSYYVSKNMYYQLKPHNLQAYSVNRWLAPPSQMLLPLLAQSLINSNYYHAVIAAPTNVTTTYRLATRIINFYQDFTVKPSQIVMTIQATLINNRTSRIIASQEFSARVPAPTNNPYGGVLAANQATQQILGKIVAFATNNS